MTKKTALPITGTPLRRSTRKKRNGNAGTNTTNRKNWDNENEKKEDPKQNKKNDLKKAPPPTSLSSSPTGTTSVEGGLLTTLVVPHPYMEVCYPKRARTLPEIQLMEGSVLRKLLDRSKWRSFPSGPRQCYEKGGYAHNDRVITLKIVDNTFYERLQLILAFRNHHNHHHNALGGGNGAPHGLHIQPGALPRMIGPRPMWRMTKDIAILDQLQTMELYRCTGKLPRSMNYLTKLRRLRLDGCRELDLSLLGTGITSRRHSAASSCGRHGDQEEVDDDTYQLRHLRELKVTDCEGVTPNKFRQVPHIQRLTVMRWDKSNTQTVDLGTQWVEELSSTVVFGSVQIPLLPAATPPSATAHTARNNDTNGDNNDHDDAITAAAAVPLLVNDASFEDIVDEVLSPPPPVPVPPGLTFRFRCSLQQLTFSGSRLTNKDLGNLLFTMAPKFPALHTLIVSDNPEITSFQEVCEVATTMTETTALLMTVSSGGDTPTTTTTPPVVRRMTSNLQTLKLSDTNIKITTTELESVIYFLEQLHPTIGTMKVFSYDSESTQNHRSSSGGGDTTANSNNTTTTTSTRHYAGDGPGSYFRRLRQINHSRSRANAHHRTTLFGSMEDDEKTPSLKLRRQILLPLDHARKIQHIEYLLSMNATQAFAMTGTRATTTTITTTTAPAADATSTQGGGTDNQKVVVTPEMKEALTKAIGSAVRSPTGTVAPELMQSCLTRGVPESTIWKAVRMARDIEAMTQQVTRETATAVTAVWKEGRGPMAGALAASVLTSIAVGTDPPRRPPPPIPVPVSVPVVSNPVPLAVWPVALATALTRTSYRTCNQESDVGDEENFRQDTRYDVVYHLLRHGPIFATGQTCRYKRKREYYPRSVKKRITFSK
mmetsp:Transcript_1070/g.1219  ORF Transcript_1070/g.1219 Transcript_1070/m.1219 type:complete len:882 (+) Transcript_1070:735-3380(+)